MSLNIKNWYSLVMAVCLARILVGEVDSLGIIVLDMIWGFCRMKNHSKGEKSPYIFPQIFSRGKLMLKVSLIFKENITLIDNTILSVFVPLP